MNEDPGALAPELCLAGGAVVGLIVGAWIPRSRQSVVRLLAAAACVLGLAATGIAMRAQPRTVFDTYAVDTATNAGRAIVLAATLLVLGLSTEAFADHRREAEFSVLVLLGALGTVVMVGADDLLLLFAGYLLASVPLYALAGFVKDPTGVEASLKYYLLGALLGVVMLAGVAVLYGAAGATGYGALARAAPGAPPGAVAVGFIAVMAGLLFKIGGVPGHFWVPDVTEGASAPVAALVTTVPKIGGLIAAFRLVDQALVDAPMDWSLLLALLGAASMTLGNLAAFFQTDVRRLLAYSTISQVGYLLLAVTVAGRSPIALPSLLFYLAAYAVTNLGAFAIACEFPRARTLDDYRGLARLYPRLAVVLLVCLLGLIGTPPTGVFVGKLEVFSAAIDGGFSWLAVLAVLNTVASVFYYLRWLAPVFLGRSTPKNADTLLPAGRWSAVSAYGAGAVSLLIGVGSGAVLPITTGALMR